MRSRVTCWLVALASLPLAAGLSTASAAADPAQSQAPQFDWELLDATFDRIHSVDAVDSQVAWWGTNPDAAYLGHVFRTVDGGATFADVGPDGSGGPLGFIDIEATSAEVALVLAYSPQTGSGHVFRTVDGGATWRETLTTELPSFLDCMAMFDRRHGFLMGDPVDGKFQIFSTSDAGRSWDLLPSDGMPAALEDEYGTSAGGHCADATRRMAYFGTAFAAKGRVFRSADRGLTWQVSSVPAEAGNFINSLDFRNDRLGMTNGFARTDDGGETWQVEDDVPAGGGAIAWWTSRAGNARPTPGSARVVFSLADAGSYVSRDRGLTWEKFDSHALYGMDCSATGACWAVGPGGVVAKLVTS